MLSRTHTVELIEQSLVLARELGIQVRQEWLGGRGGGSCEIKGQRWLFVDLSLSAHEQLEQVAQAIRSPAELANAPMSPELRRAMGLRRAA